MCLWVLQGGGLEGRNLNPQAPAVTVSDQIHQNYLEGGRDPLCLDVQAAQQASAEAWLPRPIAAYLAAQFM